MLEEPLRQAAAGLLEAGIRVAPPEAREWGWAMLGELRQAESGWAALSWSLGGMGVLVTHALLSLLMAGLSGRSVIAGGGLFSKNVSLRTAAFLASGAYVVGALLFFAAPPFRQGLRVSLAAWNVAFHVTEQGGEAKLRDLAERARTRRDPEGLVFVAARLEDASESARLVQQAVSLDPEFSWAYAVVAVRHPELSEIQQWRPNLERWDPQNALFKFIQAESIDISHVLSASRMSPKEWEKTWNTDPAWRMAMAAAFASRKFDDYLDRLQEIDQRVARRYAFHDPEELLAGEGTGLPSYAFWDAERYAKSLLQSGEDRQTRGQRKAASESFWTVANFGQLIDSHAHTHDEHWLGAALQSMAYKRLQVLSDREGNSHDAALFAYLGRRFDPITAARQRERDWVFGSYISRRNAAVLQISSLIMLISFGSLVLAACILIANRVRHVHRPSPGMTALGLMSAVSVLLSSATLYLTYRPYWYLFQAAVLKGTTSQTEDLRNFLTATRMLPGLGPCSDLSLKFPVYFWTGVIMAGIAGLTLILLRHIRPGTRLKQTQTARGMRSGR